MIASMMVSLFYSILDAPELLLQDFGHEQLHRRINDQVDGRDEKAKSGYNLGDGLGAKDELGASKYNDDDSLDAPRNLGTRAVQQICKKMMLLSDNFC